jgi:hypothetical protein
MADLTAKEFSELDEKGKIAFLAAEKKELDAIELEKKKTVFYAAMRAEMEEFDADAQVRIGTFHSGISGERTVIELKWKTAEETGTFELPE